MAGYGLAIDDYGTGRSNLQLLARIPFSELKIDRSFVAGASKKRALGTVLSSYLGLARSLDRNRWRRDYRIDRLPRMRGYPRTADGGGGFPC
jgi:hypothetical protein